MANAAHTDLKTVTQRGALAARKEPYFDTIGKARVLGFISAGKGQRGQWIVRLETGRTEKGPIRARKLLGVSCLSANEGDANGTTILSHKQAETLALDFDPLNAAKAKSACTILSVIEQHKNFAGDEEDKSPENMKSAYDALRFKVLGIGRSGERAGVRITKDTDLSSLEGKTVFLHGDLKVSDLTSEMLLVLRKSWIDPEKPSTRATALRNWTNLHSALEQAFMKDSNNIVANKAWRKVKAMSQDFEARQMHFTDEQAVAIIDHVRARDGAIADYFAGLYVSGARAGKEMFDGEVSDFNASKATLYIRDGKNGSRTAGLSPLAVSFFRQLTAGRKPYAPMFSPDGVRKFADKTDQKRIKALLVDAVRAVLDPEEFEGDDAWTNKDIVPYNFRHTFISRRAAAGATQGQIAIVCGTSEYMINKTYGKHFPSEQAAMLAATDPKVNLNLRIVKSA